MQKRMMTSNDIRQSFLKFFREKEHHIVPSAPVVPQNDPTLLFTNAGMNQFKDIFLGVRGRDYSRVADSQKCIRVSGKHNDLEEVGRDTYHHTFFEMLGNWSFGDYFKAEAIKWAWELLTEVWGLPKDRLYATVFSGDEKDGVSADHEAAEMWRKQTDINPDHILFFDKSDNFWEMGETGPCGPCSEVHIDMGPEFENMDNADQSGVNSGSARYIELWNLVFIQYNRDESGVLHPLPNKHVDTGAGFERLVAVLQHKGSNYDTDIFEPLLNTISTLTGKQYDSETETGIAFRVLSDHIRALSFAIADGAIPGNEGRGYVLRRLLRRAARFGRVLGMHQPFFYKLVQPLVEKMGEAYPEIKDRQDYIERVIQAEEESFNRTLDRGIEIFESKVKEVLQNGKTVFPGEDAFLLHDTYGFPLDLTQLMAEENNLSVDVQAFNREMERQRQRSASTRHATYQTIHVDQENGGSEFVGYTTDTLDTVIVDAREEHIVLEKTPFYAEGGGQVGDVGRIFNDEFGFRVTDTKRIGSHIVHMGQLESGTLPSTGAKVTASVDVERRRATERNHTVTHLLHKALRQVLGDHVSQAGSLVHPNYLRFDFTHFEKPGPEALRQIESIVNQQILRNRNVHWQMMPLQQAKDDGAMALFGEKYGDEVRVVEIDHYSKELCGGTHVRATGEIGDFHILSESAVAAGIRRIEAVTGFEANEYFRSRENAVHRAASLIGCSEDDLPERLEHLLDEKKDLERELTRLRQKQSNAAIEDILKESMDVSGVRVVAAELPVAHMDELKKAGDVLRDGIGSGVGVLATVLNDKLNFVCVVTKDIIERRGLKAGDIVREVAKRAGGGGGGSPHMASAGAKDTDKLHQALSSVREIVERQLS